MTEFMTTTLSAVVVSMTAQLGPASRPRAITDRTTAKDRPAAFRCDSRRHWASNSFIQSQKPSHHLRTNCHQAYTAGSGNVANACSQIYINDVPSCVYYIVNVALAAWFMTIQAFSCSDVTHGIYA